MEDEKRLHTFRYHYFEYHYAELTEVYIKILKIEYKHFSKDPITYIKFPSIIDNHRIYGFTMYLFSPRNINFDTKYIKYVIFPDNIVDIPLTLFYFNDFSSLKAVFGNKIQIYKQNDIWKLK